MLRHAPRLVRVAAATGVLLALGAFPAGAGAKTHSVAPGHIRGIVTADTPGGRALADRKSVV